MHEYEIKKTSEDFQVTEVLPLIHCSSSNSVKLYLLKKSGYRTLEAITILEEFLNIQPPDRIGFAGLKDEDGVTAQYVSLPRALTTVELQAIREKFEKMNGDYLVLIPYLPVEKHLEIGKLHGNCFRVKVRRLSKSLINKIREQKEYSMLLINYYGPQRFGLPGQVKNTNIIGKAILDQDYDLALAQLSLQNSPEGIKARQYMHFPEAFFKGLDIRLIAFYQSSYFSSIWNESIRNVIRKNSLVSRLFLVDEVEYRLLSDHVYFPELLAGTFSLKNKRAKAGQSSIKYQEYTRPPVISSKIMIEEVGVDELNPGYFFSTLSFFLPSGSYASIVVPQFLAAVDAVKSSQLQMVAAC